MKLIKTKLATGLVLGAVMFGMLSFTTTPIAAQDTTSGVSASATDDEKAISYSVARRLAGIVVIAVAAAVEHFFGTNVNAAGEYAADSLD